MKAYINHLSFFADSESERGVQEAIDGLVKLRNMTAFGAFNSIVFGFLSAPAQSPWIFWC
jgi:hypothetical protein